MVLLTHLNIICVNNLYNYESIDKIGAVVHFASELDVGDAAAGLRNGLLLGDLPARLTKAQENRPAEDL